MNTFNLVFTSVLLAAPGRSQSSPTSGGMLYSTYLGGDGTEIGSGIAVDSSGAIYVTGATTSPNFPWTSGSPQGGREAFVAKFDPSICGSASLCWAVPLSGTGDDAGIGVKIGPGGEVYVTGQTQSSNFPTTANAYQPALGGSIDGFLVTLSAGSGAEQYGTYIGGVNADTPYDLAVDSAGRAWIVGGAESGFPMTPGAIQSTATGLEGFVCALDPTVSGQAGLVYSTYYGGDASDNVTSVAVDASGNVFFAGQTDSSNLVLVNPLLGATGGPRDGFAGWLHVSPSWMGSLLYSTYLGGTLYDAASGIAITGPTTVCVVGATQSSGFPTPSSVAQGVDAFLVKLDMSQAGPSSLLAWQVIAGSGDDYATSVSIGPGGEAYISGGTNSQNLPTTPSAFQPAPAGGSDLFVAKLDVAQPGAAVLEYCSYVGGSGDDDANADVQRMEVSGCGIVNVIATTSSTNFPTTPCGYQQALRTARDAVVFRLDMGGTCGVSSFCFGDGTGAPCPCGNSGNHGAGCENSATTGGAVLTGAGTASLSSDTLVLTSAGERPTAFSIFLQGTQVVGPLIYGDGLRCVGGTLKRLYAKNAVGGVVSAPQGTDPAISSRSATLGDVITAGDVRYYQVYYRDPSPTFCANPPGNTWNISNAVSVVWLP